MPKGSTLRIMDTTQSNQTGVKQEIEEFGFSVLPNVFGRQEVELLIESISKIEREEGVRSRGGVYAIRNLLHLSPVVMELAYSTRVRSIVGEILRDDVLAVRATLFDKTTGANWLVPWHQDLTVCVDEMLDVPGYGPWTTKAGVWHVQPPASILERMLSLRIHLDDCDESNGALRVLRGTHRVGRLNAAGIAERQRTATAVSCVVGAGGILLMRPLLIHASSAASKATHRRVIHVDYASCSLDGGLRRATPSKA
jgi:ectoine hydroxylase-related dioxygenase (phytanoyl-CoA dioxygenase family)